MLYCGRCRIKHALIGWNKQTHGVCGYCGEKELCHDTTPEEDYTPRIPPQRARAAVVTALRELADAVERGDIQYLFYGALNTPEAAKDFGSAFRQVHGYVGDPEAVESFFWMTPLGMARSIYLDVESQLTDIGTGTVDSLEVFRV
jgi:hypothetical protein